MSDILGDAFHKAEKLAHDPHVQEVALLGGAIAATAALIYMTKGAALEEAAGLAKNVGAGSAESLLDAIRSTTASGSRSSVMRVASEEALFGPGGTRSLQVTAHQVEQAAAGALRKGSEQFVTGRAVYRETEVALGNGIKSTPGSVVAQLTYDASALRSGASSNGFTFLSKTLEAAPAKVELPILHPTGDVQMTLVSADHPFTQTYLGNSQRIIELRYRDVEGVWHGGSGLVVKTADPCPTIVTANHVVVHQAEDGLVRLRKPGSHGPTSWDHGAKVIYSDPSTDVAVLKVSNRANGADSTWLMDGRSLTQADAVVPKIGDTVAHYGYGGRELDVATAKVTGTGKPSELFKDLPEHAPKADVIKVDESIGRGMSGGPVFDMQGHMIGLTSFSAPEGTGLTSAMFPRTALTQTKNLLAVLERIAAG